MTLLNKKGDFISEKGDVNYPFKSCYTIFKFKNKPFENNLEEENLDAYFYWLYELDRIVKSRVLLAALTEANNMNLNRII